MCSSHIYLLVLYRLSVLPIPFTILFKLERILLQFICAARTSTFWSFTDFQCFQSRSPSYSSWKESCISSSGSFGAVGHLSASPVLKRPRSAERRDETPRHILRLGIPGRICSHDDETGAFCKEDAKLSFLSLRSVHSAEGRDHRLTRNECPSSRECRHALKVLSRLKAGLFDGRLLSYKALYRTLVIISYVSHGDCER